MIDDLIPWISASDVLSGQMSKMSASEPVAESAYVVSLTDDHEVLNAELARFGKESIDPFAPILANMDKYIEMMRDVNAIYADQISPKLTRIRFASQRVLDAELAKM